jgi:hypothetical protein
MMVEITKRQKHAIEIALDVLSRRSNLIGDELQKEGNRALRGTMEKILDIQRGAEIDLQEILNNLR